MSARQVTGWRDDSGIKLWMEPAVDISVYRVVPCPMHVRMSVEYLATSKSYWKYCNRWNHKESFEPEKLIISPFLHTSLLSHPFQKIRGRNNHRETHLHDPHCAESRSGQISFCHGEWLLIHIALSRNYVNSLSTGFDITLQSVLRPKISAAGFYPSSQNLCTKKDFILPVLFILDMLWLWPKKVTGVVFPHKNITVITLC